MHIHQLISPDRVACCPQSGSKQRTLEQLSQLLARDLPNLTAAEIFDSLLGRERLGSTGFGRGVAIPHGRVSGLHKPIGAFLRLDSAVDYDALDHRPVDLLFALLVPEEVPDAHLQLLAELARMFGDADFSQRLRGSHSSEELYDLLQHWEAPSANA